jgi:hypothetical protein
VFERVMKRVAEHVFEKDAGTGAAGVETGKTDLSKKENQS